MTRSFDEAVTDTEHDALDHKIAPHNLLDATAHGLLGHTTPPLSLLDAAAHDLLNHTIPPLSLLNSTTHNSDNHAGVTAIQPPSQAEAEAGVATTPRLWTSQRVGQAVTAQSKSGIVTLDATATEVEINAALALATTSAVQLLPGNYSIAASISVPQGKSLLGSGGGADFNGEFGNGSRLLFTNASSRLLLSSNHSRVGYLGIRLDTSSSFDLISSSAEGIIVEHVGIDYNGNDARRAIQLTSGPSAVRYVVIDGSGQTSPNEALIFISAPGNDQRSVVEHCHVKNGNSHGIEVAQGVSVFNCLSQGNAGQGIRLTNPDKLGIIRDCMADQNGSDGFFVSGNSGTAPVVVAGCFADNNGGWGFNLAVNGTSGTGMLIGPLHSGNVSGGRTSGTSWDVQHEHAI
ncbi:MAG TPA: right-handed parallel beta-helix repeat-containing protein [Thermoleophilia bacterium]|nr:right-handed parallel beta-helix repeat-containing protein [Thermoleophilia bacterium]